MTVAPLEISRPLGFCDSWFFANFGALRLDYVKNRNSQYRLEDCIAFAETYESKTKNKKQKRISEVMMKQALDYMKGMVNAV